MLDATDQQIIKELSANSRITMKELGEKVHLTGPATATRVEKLEDEGFIEGYTIQVNEEKLGNHVHAILQVFTVSNDHRSYQSIVNNYQDYVTNHYKVSGESCYMVEAKFPSNDMLDHFLSDLSLYVSYKLSIVINQVR